MSRISEKVAYLDGLMEGLNIQEDKYAKIFTAIVDALDLIAEEISDHEDTLADLDDSVEEIQLGEDHITIRWRDGETSVVEMDFSEKRYCPSRYSVFYNDYLGRIRSGEKKNKYKFLMGLTPAAVQAG